MATVFRRGKNWFAQWYRADGTRIKKATRTDKRRDAERIAAKLESDDRAEKTEVGKGLLQILNRAAEDMQKGALSAKRATEYLNEIRKVGDRDFEVMTIAEALKEWCQDQAKRVDSARNYEDMRKAVTQALGKRADAPISDFTHAEAGRLLHALRKTGRKLKDGTEETRTAATANLHFRAFRRALQAQVRAKTIADNPAEGVPPLPETDSIEKAPFTAAEVRQLLDSPHTSEEWRGCILLAAHTGLRIGDVVRLGRGNIEGSSIVIRPTKTKRKRKTLFIPLSPPAYAWIGDRQGSFFPELSKAKPATLSTWFDRLREKAKVEKTLDQHGVRVVRTFHSLRHSFTSWLAEADIHADVRQKLTGHSSAGIHAIYTHHDESLNRAIEKLPAFK